jgi:hypothetical protein
MGGDCAARRLAEVRFESSGDLRRLDLTSVVGLLPALRDEWAGLQFDRDGRLLNPLTGDTAAALTLVGGRHRQPGATYRITVTSPKLELPQGRRAEFEAEARELTRHRAQAEQWKEHAARRREASVQVRTQQEHFAASVREDNAHRLAFSVSDEPTTWTVDVDVEHGRLPKVDLDGQIDLTAVIQADGTPGCLAGLLGGTGRGAAVLELGALERGGQVVRANGRANRFRGSAKVDMQASATTWTVAGTGSLRARGLGRLVLWLAGRRIRGSIDRSVAELWTKGETRTIEMEQQLSRLRDAIETDGGSAPFVHRAIWDKGFDFRLGPLGRGTS